MSVTSPVDICNLTCSLLNVDPITSITAPTNATEEVFALWYNQTRKEALRNHSWNFAMKRTTLAALSGDESFGIGKKFGLPPDYIRVSEVGNPPLQAKDYVVEDNYISLLNGFDEDSALKMVYVSDFKTVSRMDASFIDYFSTLLGQKVAFALTQKNSSVERLDALMEKAEARATRNDGQENPPKRIQRSRSIQARRTGSNRNTHLISDY